MIFYFSVLASISAKGSVVPGHIGCIHVYKVNINPEIDTKRSRFMRLDINRESREHRYLYLCISVTMCYMCALPVRRDA